MHYDAIFDENSLGKKLKRHANINMLTCTLIMPTFTFAEEFMS